MSEWLQTYNEWLGMYNAGIITSIFGAFAVTFTVLMSWPKLVKDFGPIGGFMGSCPYHWYFLAGESQTSRFWFFYRAAE